MLRLLKNSKGFSGIITTIFLALVAFSIVTGLFIAIQQENMKFQEEVMESNQRNTDSNNEKITVTNVNYTLVDSQVQVEAQITNDGPISIEILGIWVVDAITQKQGSNHELELYLKNGNILNLTGSNALTVAIEGSNSSSIFTSWFITGRGNLIPLEKVEYLTEIYQFQYSIGAMGVGALTFDFDEFRYFTFESPTKLANYPNGIVSYDIPKGEYVAFGCYLTNWDMKKRTLTIDSHSLLWQPQVSGVGEEAWYAVNVEADGTINGTYSSISLEYGEKALFVFASGKDLSIGSFSREKTPNTVGLSPNFILLHGTLGSRPFAQNIPFVSVFYTVPNILMMDDFDEHIPPEAPDGWTPLSENWGTATDTSITYQQTPLALANIEDYVDNISNVDSSDDIGSHTNFSSQQTGPDSVYDTLTEENTGGDPTTFGKTDIGLGSRGFTGYLEASRYQCEQDGVATQITLYLTGGAPGRYARVAIYSDNTGAPGSLLGESTAQEAVSDGWHVFTGFNIPVSENTYYWLAFQISTSNLNYHYDTGLTNQHAYRSYVYGSFPSSFGSPSYAAEAQSIYLTSSATNYEFDLEVQWINIVDLLPIDELCIYAGPLGSEELRVDYWNGLDWENLFTDLNSGWNNVSVSSYLTSSTFTIRFKGGMETDDTTQDSWAIDAALLHVWEEPSASNIISVAGQPTWTDYTFQVQLKFLEEEGGATKEGASLLFRFQDASNYYYLFAVETTNELELHRIIGDVDELISSTSIALTQSQWYTVAIKIIGQTIAVWVDDVQYFSNLSSGGALADGQIGLGTKDYWCRFDNVLVYS